MAQARVVETPHQTRAHVPGKHLNTDFPLIDYDPHFSRVVRYARPSDYLAGLATGSIIPAGFYLSERFFPFPGIKQGAWKRFMPMNIFLGVCAGFMGLYTRSSGRFYGLRENEREVEMDMREMTDRVKAGLPVYGNSRLTDYMQGVAARQTRYTALFLHVIPWFNFVNHPHHGIDTAKYYQNAERELEAERLGGQSSR